MITQNVAQSRRVARNPVHNFHVRHKPFQIQPFMFAPVLPGETLKNLLMQSRAVTQPIKNPLIGWWMEYYFFYVKHRDMEGSETFQQMMIDPGTDMASQVEAGADVKLYRTTSQIDWQGQALDAIVQAYFRGEDDAPPALDGLPVAQIQHNGWFDSLSANSIYSAGDFNVDLNANATITASEVNRSLLLWEHLRNNNLVDMSYEDYLRTYGVKPDVVESAQVPELVRYVREWQYPSNTIDPTNGQPSSAVSWGISERADKDRFFREPGFLVGVTVCRPKVYMAGQATAAIGLLNDAFSWLPAVMRNDVSTSLKSVANGAGSIIPSATNTPFWVDVRDLFMYGDQFVNFALSDTVSGLVAMPTAALERRYPTNADVEGLFVAPLDEEGDPLTPPSLVEQDGVVRLSILGMQTDTTPRGSAVGTVL